MHIHILGVCGTFMGGVAQLAKAAGHQVSGSDQNVYPPMSTQLQEAGIELVQGYELEQLDAGQDLLVVGNVMRRGLPVVEAMLNRGLAYTSGPQWLGEHVLRDRWVLAVAGTHGKTTTASMLAWILEYAGLAPGFLIGGVPANFGVSARLGESPFFVVEADEYDTAFFDKRSKFVHYHPRTLVLNNLEFDHADIFDDLTAIQRQFHHLVRTVPGEGLVVANGADPALAEVLGMGCWTPVERFNGSDAEWQVDAVQAGGERFAVRGPDVQGEVAWGLLGAHNRSNALAAIAAARHAGVPVQTSLEALGHFRGVKRRMEVRARHGGITVYDDFAHHPTAIAGTLEGLRQRVGDARILAVLDPRSNTMRMGVHRHRLAASLAEADEVVLLQPDDAGWPVAEVVEQLARPGWSFDTVAQIQAHLLQRMQAGDHVLLMSNGSFGGLHQRLADALEEQYGHG